MPIHSTMASSTGEVRNCPPKAQERYPSVPTLPNFAGERIYSLALRGKDKLVLRLLCYLAAAMPVPALVFLWHIAGRSEGSSPTLWKFLVVLGAMLVWSVMTIWLLRTMVRHRRTTVVALNAEGVHYQAPKAGLFRERDIFIRWEQIEAVKARNRQYLSLITVSSTVGGFVFDRSHAREVSRRPIQGKEMAVDGGHELLSDLLVYSGLAAEATPSQSSAARPR